MNKSAKFAGCGVLAVIALATWRFISLPADEAVVVKSEVAPERGKTAAAQGKTSVAMAVSPPIPSAEAVAPQRSLDAKPAERIDDAHFLPEQTLVGTEWERDGFRLEFGAAGKLLIGGRERAEWHVEGQRIRLYRDATGEEHWLDIAGNRLMWNGQEISRVP